MTSTQKKPPTTLRRTYKRRLFINQSIIRVIILHLPRQYHHPEEQHRRNDLPSKGRLPTTTNVILRQPCQSLHRDARVLLVIDVVVAVGVDVTLRAVELNRRLDQTCQPENEEDEGPDQDTAGDEHAARA